ncbi:MAG: PIG-L family deacetylase [Bryobacteraceae bacterium]|nr:PIG-L family deacetylase [Bryobacteraceae bacterium]
MKATTTRLFRPVPASLLLLLFARALAAQPELAGAARLRLSLDRLNALGRVLMIAAHPDDENTEVLAYFARARGFRTAYLSLTRGEGGQNFLGPEQGAALGVIRTHELLEARRIDGAQQFFTRAIDFGYSKNPDEAISRWGRDAVLSDIVWVIRSFRPDVIISVWGGVARDGHGQHQASGLLTRDAYAAAADPQAFPEHQLSPWRARRLVRILPNWRPEDAALIRAANDRITLDTGAYDPLLGYSYSEVAALSRSAHSSQAFGVPQPKGPRLHSFVPMAGPPARQDLFEDIDTSWRRLPRAHAVSRLFAQALAQLDPRRPSAIVPILLRARTALAALPLPDAADKLPELDETIALAAGLWLDAAAARPAVGPGQPVPVTATVVNRSPLQARLLRVQNLLEAPLVLASNEPVSRRLELPPIPPDEPPTQPFWLAGSPQGDLYPMPPPTLRGLPVAPARFSVAFEVELAGQLLRFTRPVHYRWVDLARGERLRPLEVLPPVTVEVPPAPLVFPDGEPRTCTVSVTAHGGLRQGVLRLAVPPGWTTQPASQSFALEDGERRSFAIRVTPGMDAASGRALAIASLGSRQVTQAILPLDYPHIPRQSLFPESSAGLVRAAIRCLAKNVGYLMGAGDEVPESLRQLGLNVTLLTRETLAAADLTAFDAIVVGVRAQSARPDIAANRTRLLDYVAAGGTLIVQYHRIEAGFAAGAALAPYPISIGSERVALEDAPVAFTAPAHPLLNSPNRITQADFAGWTQERGLYFPSQWDARYQTVVSTADPGEPSLPGGILYARFGKGAYIYTSFSWFRQLPAGVPGAYRIFANLLSAGHAATP